MRKFVASITVLALLLGLCACTAAQSETLGAEASQPPTWQEQYDLGTRYLSEGNYQEAILAFTAAIQIDPKRALAYVGRGDAYVKSGETAENLAAAKADYEKAIELDETLADIYLKLAEVYQKQGDEDTAKQTLKQGLDITGSEELQRQIDEFSKLKPKEGYPKTERRDYESGEGYEIAEYDEYGQVISFTRYYADDSIYTQVISKYDEYGNQVYWKSYLPAAHRGYPDPSSMAEIYYDQSHRIVEKKSKDAAVLEEYIKYDYSNCPTVVISAHVVDTGWIFKEKHQNLSFTITYQMQNIANTVEFGGASGHSDGSNIYYVIDERDSDERIVRGTEYRADGTIKWYTVYTWSDSGLESNRYNVDGTLLP